MSVSRYLTPEASDENVVEQMEWVIHCIEDGNKLHGRESTEDDLENVAAAKRMRAYFGGN